MPKSVSLPQYVFFRVSLVATALRGRYSRYTRAPAPERRKSVREIANTLRNMVFAYFSLS